MALGSNPAAQVHAEAARKGCFTGHWGQDGTTPGMRYNLAGGYQATSENMTGLNYCIQPLENFRKITNLEATAKRAAEDLMRSPDHFSTVVAAHYKQVNIGIAWDSHIVWLVQQFEGDHIRFEQLPVLRGTRLSFAGEAVNSATLDIDRNGLKVDVYYHPLGELTRGQLAQAYCGDLGEILATFIPPAPPGSSYDNLQPVSFSYERCYSPYSESPAAQAPGTYEQAKLQFALSQARPTTFSDGFVRFVIADEWDVSAGSFTVSADIGEILALRGAGVYQLRFWGRINGTAQVIGDYHIFHKVSPPTVYGSGTEGHR